ncbi:hypothetical protein HaLaN_04848 [Haematococcus lacustris]|uniref:Uncharacterized protein n=1 Tax=Haematococcus lacustris TaxID=44745 RepID=A0A699YRZ0_HAELA|nr:hypothetical protein HaLaN_04848 [Haematococcus lacustris]
MGQIGRSVYQPVPIPAPSYGRLGHDQSGAIGHASLSLRPRSPQGTLVGAAHHASMVLDQTRCQQLMAAPRPGQGP